MNVTHEDKEVHVVREQRVEQPTISVREEQIKAPTIDI